MNSLKIICQNLSRSNLKVSKQELILFGCLSHASRHPDVNNFGALMFLADRILEL